MDRIGPLPAWDREAMPPACTSCGRPGHEGQTCAEVKAALPPRRKRSTAEPFVDDRYTGDPRVEQEATYRQSC